MPCLADSRSLCLSHCHSWYHAAKPTTTCHFGAGKHSSRCQPPAAPLPPSPTNSLLFSLKISVGPYTPSPLGPKVCLHASRHILVLSPNQCQCALTQPLSMVLCAFMHASLTPSTTPLVASSLHHPPSHFAPLQLLHRHLVKFTEGQIWCPCHPTIPREPPPPLHPPYSHLFLFLPPLSSFPPIFQCGTIMSSLQNQA